MRKLIMNWRIGRANRKTAEALILLAAQNNNIESIETLIGDFPINNKMYHVSIKICESSKVDLKRGEAKFEWNDSSSPSIRKTFET